MNNYNYCLNAPEERSDREKSTNRGGSNTSSATSSVCDFAEEKNKSSISDYISDSGLEKVDSLSVVEKDTNMSSDCILISDDEMTAPSKFICDSEIEYIPNSDFEDSATKEPSNNDKVTFVMHSDSDSDLDDEISTVITSDYSSNLSTERNEGILKASNNSLDNCAQQTNVSYNRTKDDIHITHQYQCRRSFLDEITMNPQHSSTKMQQSFFDDGEPLPRNDITSSQQNEQIVSSQSILKGTILNELRFLSLNNDAVIKLKTSFPTNNADNGSPGDHLQLAANLPISSSLVSKSNFSCKINEFNRVGNGAIQFTEPHHEARKFEKQYLYDSGSQSVISNAIRQVLKSLESMPNEKEHIDDLPELNVSLMYHQKQAISWLTWREKQKPSGGIFADDMGLGKTLTMISLMIKQRNSCTSGSSNSLKNNNYRLYPGNNLVICPSGLIQQWKREIENRVKRGVATIVVHHGTNRETRCKRLAECFVVITTYSIVMNDFKNKPNQSPLFGINWTRIILDEAHVIRNHKSQTCVAVCNLKADRRWALTGTPLHNKELDLYSLFKFIAYSPFDELSVWKQFISTEKTDGTTRLNTLMKCVMLRRTKSDLQSKGLFSMMSQKHVRQVLVRLNEQENEIYRKILNFSVTLFKKYLYDRAEKEGLLSNGFPPSTINCNTRTNVQLEDVFKNHPELARLYASSQNLQNVKSHHILVLLLRMQQVCCHLSLIKAMLEDEDGVLSGDLSDDDDAAINSLKRLSLVPNVDVDVNVENVCPNSNECNFNANNPIFKEDILSTKLKEMLSILTNEIVPKNESVVIISKWCTLLNVAQIQLNKRNIASYMFTGAVPIAVRNEIVEQFSKPCNKSQVLLLSLTAGGVGLNLTAANHLMLLDNHWNPQLEAQACDRIYRVGQTKDVYIYKFTCVNTIEETIAQIQQSKLKTADSILTGTDSHRSAKLSLDDMKRLFNVK